MKSETNIPVILGAAIFFAGIFVNFKDNNHNIAIVLGLLAIPVLMFLSYLTEKNLDVLAYLLLIVPGIIIYIGYKEGVDAAGKSNYTMY
jgi:predicted tellurium resistance membrane protein TerC